MAYTVSQNFKTAVKDETVRKSCLILFGDLFFDSTDITEEGATFEQYFNTSDDLTYGDCPSDTLSFSVVSNGNLAGYGFGKARAFLGVQTASSAYAFGDINAHIEVGANTYTASASGLYRNDTRINTGVYVSLVSDGTSVWAVGTSSSVVVNNATGTVANYTPNRFMAQKLQGGLSAVFASNTAYLWDGENVLTFEYVPMGVYNVTKPRSTVGDVVTVQDAYDNMALFDRDAKEFIDSLSYPRTLAQIYTALCNYVGVSYASSTFTYSTTSYSSSPFSDTECTCRDILWWIAERARRVAHFNRTGVLELLSISTTVRETLTANDIGQDGYSVAEYITPAVTGVLLRGSAGNSLTFGTLETAYVISANPFVGTITVSDLQAYMAIPTYVPIELNVLEADPSIDIGDFVSIKPMVESIKVLTNVYNEVYVNSSNEAYAVGSPTYSVPIMNRTVTFNGGIRATYTATGNEAREADISDTEYNANVAANLAEAKSNAYADSKTEEVDNSFTQQKVFNRLTDNGRAQGLYMDESGNIYFNATYIQSGYISADRIQANSIAVSKLTGNIKDSGNTWNIDLDNGTMTLGNISASNLTAGTINASTITITNINGANITSGTVGSTQLGTNAVTSGKINSGAVTTVKIADGAITADKIEANAVTANKINAGAVTTAKLDASAVTADKIASNAVTTVKLNASAVTAEKIATNAVTADKIQAGAVTAGKISVTDLQAIGATIGAFNIDTNSLYSGTKDSGTASGDITLRGSGTFTRSIGGTSRSSLKFAIGSKFGIASDGTVYASALTLTGGSITLGSNFSVTSAGALTATSATITGTITSSNATITGGSINIDSNSGTVDVIKLNYSTSASTVYTAMRPQGVYMQNALTGLGTYTGNLTPSLLSFSYASGNTSNGASVSPASLSVHNTSGSILSQVTIQPPDIGSSSRLITIKPVIVSTW